jgi:hypothetical protein
VSSPQERVAKALPERLWSKLDPLLSSAAEKRANEEIALVVRIKGGRVVSVRIQPPAEEVTG